MMTLRFVRLSVASLGLAALVFTAACGSSSAYPSSPSPTPTPTPTPAAPADVTITITGMNGGSSFSPNPATVSAGQTVAWRNADGVAHIPTADSGAFSTGAIAPGATSAPITMGYSGSIGYHCSIHPSMVGTLNVQ
jgi:plastocyanin